MFARIHPRRKQVRKFALALATISILGMAAPAFAMESKTATQTRTPVAQTSVSTNAKRMAEVDHYRHGMNKAVQHDRGLHRGFTHSHHYGYEKNHGKSFHAKVTSAQ
jgi:hypothetical protein